MKKKWFIILGFIVLILLIFRLWYFPKHHKTSNSIENQTEQTNKSSSQSMTVEEKVIEQAQNALESTKIVDDEAYGRVQQTIDGIMIYLNSIDDVSNVEVNYANHLSITYKVDAETVVSMLKIGYVYDKESLEVYESNSSNVYQFTLLLKRDNEVLSLTGNYVVGTEQVELAGLHGSPTGIANE
ncbi:hypothetical protein [Streptococcus sp. zg-JUN1979]|uniref:hypothetical protein n=1 Tax=Streptococcus sp. zg-JUN1979 TaxID=3391450 RepID=UPI0039A5ED54